MNVVMRDPAKLHLHPLRSHFPKIDIEAADWIALTKSVNAGGVQQPILIVEPSLIVDGHWRWQSAKDWQHKEIPCVVVKPQEAACLIAETLICRKQMTRGATVYLMMPIMREVATSAEFRRLENVKAGRVTGENVLNPQHFEVRSNSSPEGESIRTLSFRWGIDPKTFRVARNVWGWLHEADFAALRKLHTDMGLAIPSPAALRQLQEDLREDFEPALLTGEKNLWNVESGIKGRLTGGEHQPPQQQLELFGSALESLATRAARFATPAKAAPEIKRWIEATEKEMLEAKGLPHEEFVAKLQQVAETCSVTSKTIAEYLKAKTPAKAN